MLHWIYSDSVPQERAFDDGRWRQLIFGDKFEILMTDFYMKNVANEMRKSYQHDSAINILKLSPEIAYSAKFKLETVCQHINIDLFGHIPGNSLILCTHLY